MPSFTQITALATVALAAFTTAAPVDLGSAANVVPLPAIFTQVLSDLTPLTSALSSIDASNATEAVVKPIIDQIESILTGAVGDISSLAGQPLSAILATADGVIDATGAANLLAPVLTQVYGATQTVLNVVDGSPAGAVLIPILNTALAALDPVLSAAAPLVNGLLVALAPLVVPVVNTLDGLGLGPVVSLLNSIL